MNIFYLDRDPQLAAQYQCDKHVVKMVLESAQLLSTAYPDQRYYRHTHMNHPCAIWVRQSRANWQWLLLHALWLGDEYTFRYDKEHKSYTTVLRPMMMDHPELPNLEFTDPPLAMPPEYHDDDAVVAYRTYYKGAKSRLLTYTRRLAPAWLELDYANQ